MLLHRFAVMSFITALPAVARWGYVTSDGVAVHIDEVMGSDEAHRGAPSTPPGPKVDFPQTLPVASPTRLILRATATADWEYDHPAQIALSDASRALAERALSEMAAALGVLAEAPWDLSSPNPCVFVEAEESWERALVERCVRVRMPRPRFPPPYKGQRLGQVVNLPGLLSDRLDGLLLLGAAHRARHGVAKLHELFRVLENGFGCAGASLIQPLSQFLSTHPWALDYSRTEVEGWVLDLRHPATHADLARARRIAYDSDVERFIPRIEQAAYDVLYNKTTWNARDPGRTMRRAFEAAIDAGGGVIVADAPVLRTDMPFDHFGTFPLTENFRLTQDPEATNGLLPGAVYLAEEEWSFIEGHED